MNLEKYDLSKFSPMMKQYLEIKKDYTDAIVFFRLGDFYEMFFDDAILASRELELQLTGKDCGQDERVPMCGIPFHAYEIYALKLVEKGYKIAIVEQIEDPKLAKDIVKRGVVRILTSGTCVIGELQDKDNVFLAAIRQINKIFILAYTDILTGNLYLTKLDDFSAVLNELQAIDAKELLFDKTITKRNIDTLKANYKITLSEFNQYDIPTYLTNIVYALNEDEKGTIGLIINYILKTQREKITNLKPVEIYETNEYLKLDIHSKRNLELIETVRRNQKSGSLLYLLDDTKTAMGSRMLKRWINYPLINKEKIEERLNYVEAFLESDIIRQEVINGLKGVYDLERILGKITYNTCNAKDLSQLRRTLENTLLLKEYLASSDLEILVELSKNINPLIELKDLLKDAILENPSYLLREGNMINPSYDKELQELHDIKNNGHEWLANYEAQEKEKSGIKTLKVGFNKVFGYYIEVSKSFLGDPYLENFERKQTLVNAERFITKELKDFEVKVLSASDKICALEYEIFCNIKEEVSKYTRKLQELADIISSIDAFVTLASVAKKYHYVRPRFNLNHEVTIIDGFHPVLYDILKQEYVKNDLYVNKYNTLLITGPNMSGKSTYMKMIALIVIMAQMGSFVPATSANLPIFDQIFTRIGASDDLNLGQSTFMVEMLEANYAIKNATKDSLILFDELGRGTATYDGLALAQAIIEYIHERIGCVTLFSTHYHELVLLEKSLSRLKNIHVAAKEDKGKVVFLHKVKDGPIDKSYGINVAQLAGLPKSLVERSKMILETLEEDGKEKEMNLSLFDFATEEELEEPNYEEKNIGYDLITELEDVDINNLTPLEAFNIIIKLKSML